MWTLTSLSKIVIFSFCSAWDFTCCLYDRSWSSRILYSSTSSSLCLWRVSYLWHNNKSITQQWNNLPPATKYFFLVSLPALYCCWWKVKDGSQVPYKNYSNFWKTNTLCSGEGLPLGVNGLLITFIFGLLSRVSVLYNNEINSCLVYWSCEPSRFNFLIISSTLSFPT